VRLSAQTREGLNDLHETIQAQIWHRGPPSHEELYITQERHYQALTAAITACRLAIDHLNQNASPEFVALDLRETLFQLGSILGTNVTEDILDAIFSQFCVGK
jgi:tRNA modification GTPase